MKPKYWEKTSPSATLSTTNPTWHDLGSNPGRRGGKPATNHLSYGTAYIIILLFILETRHEHMLKYINPITNGARQLCEKIREADGVEMHESSSSTHYTPAACLPNKSAYRKCSRASFMWIPVCSVSFPGHDTAHVLQCRANMRYLSQEGTETSHVPKFNFTVHLGGTKPDN
jgi:hypothetical protein